MNSNIRSVRNNYIHNTESTILNQRIPNQQIQIKQYRISRSESKNTESWCQISEEIGLFSSYIGSFHLVWGCYFPKELRLGILMRLWHIFLRSLWLILWTFCKELAIFYKVCLTLCLFWCGLCDISDFLVYSADLGLGFMHFLNQKQNQVETKKSSQTQAKLHLTCSYITPARPVSQSKAQWATQKCSRAA